MDGFIKIHRQITEWEWYKDTTVKILFLHCLLRANREDKNWQGKIIKKGSFVTSYEKLSFETGLTYKQVRLALDKLKRTGEVAHEGQTSYSIITVKNWDKFQCEGRQQGRQRATNKNINKDSYIDIGETKKFVKPTIEKIKSYCLERNNQVDAVQFYDYYESNGWKVGKNSMKDWKATIRTWERNKFSNKKKEQFDYANTPWKPY